MNEADKYFAGLQQALTDGVESARKLPSYAELITVFENAETVRSIGLTEKRITVLVEALRIADSGIVASFREMLDYMGGSDVKGDHPLARAHAVRDTLDKIELLTEHPPCQALAPVERFDLHKLDAVALALLRDIRKNPVKVDNFQFVLARAQLLDHGLATVEWERPDLHPSKNNAVIITITAKGRTAR